MKKQNVTEFVFSEIPLREAQAAVAAGFGKYSGIKTMLLERLEGLAPDKAFAFGLGNGKELEPDERKRMSVAINVALSKSRVGWKVAYSGTRKAFVCVPKQQKRAPSQRNGPMSEEDVKKVVQLRKSRVRIKEISEQLGLSIGQVQKVSSKMRNGEIK